MGGMDAMLATVQMPPGFPVATVAMDKAGARNAAWLAAQILAVADPALDEKIRAARAKMQAGVEEAAAKIPGVSKPVVDLDAKELRYEESAPVDEAALRQAIFDIGFDPQ